MTEQSVALDKVVVTGTPGGQALRELGNSVTTVNAAKVTEQGTVNNIEQLLKGRSPGVFVNPATGNVGTPPSGAVAMDGFRHLSAGWERYLWRQQIQTVRSAFGVHLTFAVHLAFAVVESLW